MKKQTALQWLIGYYYDNEGAIGIKQLEQAEQMEKEQMIDAINTVSENNVKYANMIVSSWSKIEGELFMHNTKLGEQYYEQTYGGQDENQS